MKNFNFCNNCGKSGHLFHQCKIPITSIGIILLRKNINSVEILLICRKNSLGFVDFMRGKYNIYNKKYILTLLNRMSLKERKQIKEMNFNELWNNLWGDVIAQQYKNEEKSSMEKLELLKHGINLNNELYNLNNLLDECNETYLEPEWGFPKGRRNFQEKDIECGMREFEEETGYNKHDISFIDNIIPFEEIYTGTNYKSYKHKYFLGYIDNNKNPINQFQKTEISDVELVNINNCENYIRDYSIEKINIINKIKTIIERYNIFV